MYHENIVKNISTPHVLQLMIYLPLPCKLLPVKAAPCHHQMPEKLSCSYIYCSIRIYIPSSIASWCMANHWSTTCDSVSILSSEHPIRSSLCCHAATGPARNLCRLILHQNSKLPHYLEWIKCCSGQVAM